jgi:hypothetical protein
MELTSADLKKSRFEPLRSSIFFVSTITANDAEATLPELPMTMTSIRSSSAPPSYEQYSMLFLGPIEPVLSQGIYRFRHDVIGEISLFLVPVGRDEEGTQYEVCVSRKTLGD